MGKREAGDAPSGGRGRGGGRGGRGGGKRSKYTHNNDANHAMPFGKQGILITLDCGDPGKARKEALLVLGEAYEQLDPTPQAPVPEEPEEEAPTDFSKAIDSEVTDLKDRKQQRFKFYEMGLRNCMFIEMDVTEGKPGPREVVLKILRTAMETKVLQFRFCTRLLPCTHICSSTTDTIKAFAAKTVPTMFDCGEDAKQETVAVLYEHRASSTKLDRLEMIDMFVDHVPCPPHKVQLRGASKTISVQVCRNTVGVAALEDYHLLHKYNIKHICSPPEEKSDTAKTTPVEDNKTADVKDDEAAEAKAEEVVEKVVEAAEAKAEEVVEKVDADEMKPE